MLLAGERTLCHLLEGDRLRGKRSETGDLLTTLTERASRPTWPPRPGIETRSRNSSSSPFGRKRAPSRVRRCPLRAAAIDVDRDRCRGRDRGERSAPHPSSSSAASSTTRPVRRSGPNTLFSEPSSRAAFTEPGETGGATCNAFASTLMFEDCTIRETSS